MSALLRRFRTGRKEAASSDGLAALAASLEANSRESRTVSHREFRKYIQEHDQSKTEAWVPIRAAARNNGRR